MERKTKIHAEDGKQELVITREFDLPVALLFKAYVEPALVAQWMGTRVLKLDCRSHGSWQFETAGSDGSVVFRSHGTIHAYEPDRKIIRTFEMENTPFDVQLEFLDFVPLSETTSKLTMHIVYRSVELRDQMLRLPFAHGLNQAHNRLEKIVQNLTPDDEQAQ